MDTPVTLAELRKRHGGMSQRELARRLGVTPGAVALWETGNRVPRLAMVRKIAQLFGLKSSDLIIFGKQDKDDHSSPPCHQNGLVASPETSVQQGQVKHIRGHAAPFVSPRGRG